MSLAFLPWEVDVFIRSFLYKILDREICQDSERTSPVGLVTRENKQSPEKTILPKCNFVFLQVRLNPTSYLDSTV